MLDLQFHSQTIERHPHENGRTTQSARSIPHLFWSRLTGRDKRSHSGSRLFNGRKDCSERRTQRCQADKRSCGCPIGATPHALMICASICSAISSSKLMRRLSVGCVIRQTHRASKELGIVALPLGCQWLPIEIPLVELHRKALRQLHNHLIHELYFLRP